MTIYIKTTLAGQEMDHKTFVWSCWDKDDLFHYVDGALACHNENPRRRDNIDELLDLIADHGPGMGSRYHRRIDRKEAERLIRAGAKNLTLL